MRILKNIFREKVMMMMKFELFLNLFPVENLKDVIIPKTDKLLKHAMKLG